MYDNFAGLSLIFAEKKRKASRKRCPTKENAVRFYFCHSNINSACKSSRILCSRTHLKCPSSNSWIDVSVKLNR